MGDRSILWLKCTCSTSSDFRVGGIPLSQITILIVDDDRHIRELIRFYIKREGFHILEAENGQQAQALMDSNRIDLALVDVMLPGINGLELCGEIRKYWDIPVLMVTAKGELDDRVEGFERGADDYIVKPFYPDELLMRVKALLRRYKINASQSVRIGPVHLDHTNYEVRKGSEKIKLTLKEFKLLFLLASYPSQVFTRDQLIERIWGMDYEKDERTVDVHIKRLRDCFLDCRERFSIVTHKGLGYSLEVHHD